MNVALFQQLIVALFEAASYEDFFVDCADYIDDFDILVDSILSLNDDSLIVKLDDNSEFEITIKKLR